MSRYVKPRLRVGKSGVSSAVIGDGPIASVGFGQRGTRTQRYAERNRKSPTPAEKELAKILRKTYPGLVWNEQWSFNNEWILDFYAFPANVGIEVDGGYHNTPNQVIRDQAKTRACEARGITLVRLKNADVFGDRNALLKKLREGFLRASQAARMRSK